MDGRFLTLLTLGALGVAGAAARGSRGVVRAARSVSAVRWPTTIFVHQIHRDCNWSVYASLHPFGEGGYGSSFRRNGAEQRIGAGGRMNREGEFPATEREAAIAYALDWARDPVFGGRLPVVQKGSRGGKKKVHPGDPRSGVAVRIRVLTTRSPQDRIHVRLETNTAPDRWEPFRPDVEGELSADPTAEAALIASIQEKWNRNPGENRSPLPVVREQKDLRGRRGSPGVVRAGRPAPAKKLTKYVNEYVLQANYGHGDGWEDLVAEASLKELKLRHREYQESAPGGRYRRITRRVLRVPAGSPGVVRRGGPTLPCDAFEATTLLTLSTHHLSASDAAWLTAYVRGDRFEDRVLTGGPTGYGWIFMVDESLTEQEGLSKDFLRIVRYTIDCGADWIRFDQDGPIVDDLPTFDG